jgi:hypothetical protein
VIQQPRVQRCDEIANAGLRRPASTRALLETLHASIEEPAIESAWWRDRGQFATAIQQLLSEWKLAFGVDEPSAHAGLDAALTSGAVATA